MTQIIWRIFISVLIESLSFGFCIFFFVHYHFRKINQVIPASGLNQWSLVQTGAMKAWETLVELSYFFLLILIIANCSTFSVKVILTSLFFLVKKLFICISCIIWNGKKKPGTPLHRYFPSFSVFWYYTACQRRIQNPDKHLRRRVFCKNS